MKKLILALALVLGCSSGAWAGFMEDATGVSELKKEIERLRLEIDSINKKIHNINTYIPEHIANTWRIEVLEKESFKTSSCAYITPTESRFSVVTSPTGRYAVSVTNVKNYASGSKVTLEFINLYGVQMDGVEAEIVATPILPEGTDYKEIEKQQKTVSNMVGLIPAGTARTKTFSIPEIPAEKLKMLKVTVTEKGVRYHKN